MLPTVSWTFLNFKCDAHGLSASQERARHLVIDGSSGRGSRAKLGDVMVLAETCMARGHQCPLPPPKADTGQRELTLGYGGGPVRITPAR